MKSATSACVSLPRNHCSGDKRLVRASHIANLFFCEQKIVLDRQYGESATPEQLNAQRRGNVVHSEVDELARAHHNSGGCQDFEENERQHMPPEIANGKLVLSEQVMFAPQVGLVAKVDQVYLAPDGLLVPVENKTRKAFVENNPYRQNGWNGVHSFDRAELSVQGVVLRYGVPEDLRAAKVAEYGYVVVRREGDAPRWNQIQLFGGWRVSSLRKRRLALEAGEVSPNGPITGRICRKCAQAWRCPHACGVRSKTCRTSGEAVARKNHECGRR